MKLRPSCLNSSNFFPLVMAQQLCNLTSKPDRTNAATWPTGLGMVVFLSVLNICLSITASLGNILILTALPKVTCLHPPTKLLFRCLAVTDLCVGLVSHPLHATFIILKTKLNVASFIIGSVNSTLSVLLSGVSVVTATAVSVDRLVALSLGLRYRQVVTLTRIRVFTLFSWISGALLGSMHIWAHPDVVWDIASFITLLCLVTSIFCYTKIHLKLRQYRFQVQAHLGQQNTGVSLNIARYKKTVSSTFWVLLALIVCYTPFCVVSALNIREKGCHMAWLLTTTLAYLNSSMNPILYCWKIREVNRTVKDTVRQLCGVSNADYNN